MPKAPEPGTGPAPATKEPALKAPGPKKPGPKKTVNTRRPFTHADAIEAGIAPKLLRGSTFRRIFRGVYVDATTPVSPRQRAEAALCFFTKDAFASHASAGRIHEVPCRPCPTSTSVSRSRNSGASIRGSRSTWPRRPTCLSSTTSGSPPTTRCSSSLPASWGWSTSPMETRLRMLLVLAGLPEPDINRTLRTEDGEPVRRHDLSYPAVKVIVEYDGRQHIERVESWEADLTRREAIDDDGWRILVVVSSGIYKHPEQTVLRVWRLLRSRGLPGVPATPAADWRPHFPGRP